MPRYNLYLQIPVNHLFNVGHCDPGIIFHSGLHKRAYRLWYVHIYTASDFDLTTDGFSFWSWIASAKRSEGSFYCLSADLEK